MQQAFPNPKAVEQCGDKKPCQTLTWIGPDCPDGRIFSTSPRDVFQAGFLRAIQRPTSSNSLCFSSCFYIFFLQTLGVSRRLLRTFGSSEWCNGVQLFFICQGYAIKEDAEWLPWLPPTKTQK